jgi:carbohydrate kinase (thermoresistant glucokinase family)
MPVAPRRLTPPLVLVLMGVSGSGKTTVARLIAERLHWAFEEGDALHPPANVAKMAAGHPLDDDDRAPWLGKVADWVDARLDAGESGVITCSALKRKYRALIDRRGERVEFVYLHGSPELVASRLAARQGHFMPSSLLASQFDTLEEPAADEPVIRVEIAGTPDSVADAVLQTLGLAA